MSTILALSLAPAALLLGLPALVDSAAWILGRLRRKPPPRECERQRLLFLVPAHDEELLIERTLRSLLGQRYPRDHLNVLVIADNCSDRTAEVARRAGSRVIERRAPERPGKGHAIAWALERIDLDAYDAVVLIDADTIVAPDFAQTVGQRPLSARLVQSYDGLSNENENWLTRLAGLLTRSRYDIALPIKADAGLNAPLTGNGTIIGTDVLRHHGWNIQTITEGWELYARHTLAGVRIDYEREARIYAQETGTLRQSRSQRRRWSEGRLSVLAMYWRPIVTTRGVSLLQRLDLIAELSSLGPVMRAFLGTVGMVICLVTRPAAFGPLVALFASTVFHPLLYVCLSLPRHPSPARALLAFCGLPAYAIWRISVGIYSLVRRRRRASPWTRTSRSGED